MRRLAVALVLAGCAAPGYNPPGSSPSSSRRERLATQARCVTERAEMPKVRREPTRIALRTQRVRATTTAGQTEPNKNEYELAATS